MVELFTHWSARTCLFVQKWTIVISICMILTYDTGNTGVVYRSNTNHTKQKQCYPEGS